MKNIIFTILSLLPLCFSNSTFGQAQATPSRSATSQQFETLENNFEVKVEMLSVVQLEVFQKKSEQQIQDWVDMIDLLQSQDWKPKLKEKLNEQAIRYFTSPTDSLFFLEEKKLKATTIEKFIETLKTNSNTSTKVTIIETSNPIIEVKNYSWIVLFQNKKQDNSVKKFKAKFVLKQEKKAFGKEVKEVWDVFIQEIKEI